MSGSSAASDSLSKFPKSVCILDIETAGRHARTPDLADLAVVGLKFYTWNEQQKGYLPGPYEHYAPTDLPALQQRLDGLLGPIIGHNLFGFDYRVLRRHLNLERIVEKSADTLHFLYEQSGGDEDGSLYSLDKLAKENFGEGKTAKASTIPKLLKEGKLAEVLAYNERDCDLTFRVWWKMVSERHISVGEDWIEGLYDYELSEVTYDLEEKDISVLTSATPRFTYTAWVDQLERDSWIVMPPKERQRREEERERQRKEAWEAAKKRDQAMRAFIEQHLRDDIPRKFAPKWGTYEPDAPLDPIDIEEARAVLGRAGLPGSAWAEEVICRLRRGNTICPARLELAGRPDNPGTRAELVKSILVALADDGYIPRYHAGDEPDDDSVSLTSAPPKPRTLAEQYVDRMHERYRELDALFGPSGLGFEIMRLATGVHAAYTQAMNALRSDGYVVFEDGSYVLDTDEIDLFKLQPKVLTSEERADLEAYIRDHPDEFGEALQPSDE